MIVQRQRLPVVDDLMSGTAVADSTFHNSDADSAR